MRSSFDKAFRDGVASCRAECHCGRVFYNPTGSWDWDEGEIDALVNANATALDYAPGYITFDGRTFVDACTCWHRRADQIVAFLTEYDEKIAEYLTLERKRKQAEAERAPIVQ